MLATLKTLVIGASARAEENVRDVYAIELIDQKIREATEALKAAKLSLASLIQRQRSEHSQSDRLRSKIVDMTTRAKEAMEGGREDLARQAAKAIADMENELTVRQATLDRLDTRILHLKSTIEAANRRLIDLKQGAVAARAVRREQGMQRRLTRTTHGMSAMEEAEGLVAQVLGADDPFEQSQILKEIDEGLDHTGLAGRMAEAGFGDSTKTTADDVLARLTPEK